MWHCAGGDCSTVGGSIEVDGLAQGGTEEMTWAVMGVRGGERGWGGGATGRLFLDMSL